jgi:hypothetical protein
MERIPLCWKCASRIMKLNEDGKSYSLVGCKENTSIHDYSDAKKLCPVIKEQT